jgi:hypothetical protein
MDDFDPREYNLIGHEQWKEEKEEILENFKEEK